MPTYQKLFTTAGGTIDGGVTVGSDGSGQDVIFHSGTAGDNFTWDSSEEKLTITGTSGAVALDIHTGKATFGDAGTTYCTINQNTLMFKSATGDIGTSTAHNVHFKTNSTTRMTITSAGNVGIGATSPEASLDVNTNITAGGGVAYGTIIRGSESADGDNLDTGDGIGLKFEIPIDTATSNIGASIEAIKSSHLDSNSETKMILKTSGNDETLDTAFTIFSNQNTAIEATKGFYLDGGGNTFISEVSADTMQFTTGGSERLRILDNGDLTMKGDGGHEVRYEHGSNNTTINYYNSGGYFDSLVQRAGSYQFKNHAGSVAFQIVSSLSATFNGDMGIGGDSVTTWGRNVTIQTASASSAPALTLANTATDIADDGVVGAIEAQAGAGNRIAGILFRQEGTSENSGDISFTTGSAGTPTEKLRILANGTANFTGNIGMSNSTATLHATTSNATMQMGANSGVDAETEIYGSKSIKLKTFNSSYNWVDAISIDRQGAVTFLTSPIFGDVISKHSAQYPTTATLSTADTVGTLNLAHSNGASCELKFQINGANNTTYIPNVSYHYAVNTTTAYNQYFKMSDGTNIGQIEFHPTSTSLIVTRVNQPLAFGVNNSHKMTIGTTGYIGIGISSADTNLHIHKGSAGSVDTNSNAQFTIENSDHNAMQFLSPNDKNNIIYFGDVDDNDVGYINYVHSTNTMNFQTNASIQMSINSSGNVGIGTSSPDASLDISSSGVQDLKVTSSDSVGRLFLTGATQADIIFKDSGGGSNTKMMQQVVMDNVFKFRTLNDAGAVGLVSV